MTLAELVSSVEFIVDERGNRKAAVVDWPTWEEILSLLEDLEDSQELLQARQEEDETIPWEQVKADYQAAHPDTNV